MCRIALIGANGHLGTDLVRRFEPGHLLFPLSHADLEICDHDQVRVVLNTSAFHKVEACEHDGGRARAVNCHAVRNLAIVGNDLDAQPVHFSTDYAFGDGASPAISGGRRAVPS